MFLSKTALDRGVGQMWYQIYRLLEFSKTVMNMFITAVLAIPISVAFKHRGERSHDGSIKYYG
jgi:hypothetical protein